ncbi:MAG TPA: DUF6790 family protein [Solirubrobacterales bacterium]|nr:DUF6790 family protein [Solirubrobacterales bacterium]
MIYVVYALVAVAGIGIHLWRHPEDRAAARAVEVSLVWWIVVTIGVSGILAGLLHLFDGPAIAREIGFTRGDGGFQTEVGFNDLALGVAAVLCARFRDRYLLAVLIVATISLWGDAYGHVHQEIVNDNHDPDNTGPVLYADVLFPLVGLALYAARERLLSRRASAAAAA